MLHLLSLILCGVLAFAGGRARAAQWHAVGEDRLVRQWTTADGLPTDHLNGIALGPDGRLWIASFQGLIIFDGRAFTPVGVGTPGGVHSARVVRVARQPGADAMWVVFEDRRLERHGGDGVQRFEPLGPGEVRFAEGPDALWVTAGDGALWTLGDTPRRVGTLDQDVDRMTVQADGDLWVRVAGSHRWMPLDGRFRAVTARAVTADALPERTHGRWALRDFALLRDGERALPWSEWVFDFVEADGAIWASTWGRGLVRISDRAVDVVMPPDGLGEAVDRLWWDPAGGRLWARSQGTAWWAVAEPSQRLDPPTLADHRLSVVQQGNTTALPFSPDGVARWWASRGLVLAEDAADGGLAELSGAPAYWDALETLRTPDGALWLGTSSGVFRYAEGAWAAIAPDPGPGGPGRLRMARAAAALADGSVVIGGEGGVTWVGPAGAPVRGPMAPRPTTVRHLRLAGDVLWVSTEERGLCALPALPAPPAWGTEDAWRCLDQGNGLGSHGVHASVVDDHGRTWVSANRGLGWAATSALDAFAAGAQDVVLFTWLAEEDGLRSTEANGFAGGAVWRSETGALYFPTQAGVVRVDPRRVSPRATPRVRFGAAAVAGESAPTEGLRVDRPDAVVELSWGGISLGSSQPITYRHRLDAGPWSAPSGTESVLLRGLTPGEHQLEVQASLGDGWGPGAAVSIVRAPTVWERPWIRLAGFLALPALLVGVFGLRGRISRRRTAALSEHVARATAALADASGQLEARNRTLAEQAETLDGQLVRMHEQAEELRRLYEQSAAQASRLAEIDRLKRRFIANVSHELRTPITLIIGPLSAMRDRLPEGELRDAAGLALRNADRLQNMVRQLLSIARAQAGTLAPKVRRVAIGRLVTASLRRFPATPSGSGPAVCVPEPDPAVWCDPEMVDTALGNLMANAREHGRAPIEVDVVVLEGDGVAPAAVRVTVRDHGPGLPATGPDGLFDRFQDDGRDRAERGLGLGLALTRELVELQGGSVGAGAAEGGGARFWITLPLGVEHLALDELSLETPADGAGAPAPPDAELGDAGASILLVEDNGELRAFLQAQLARHHRVRAVASAEAALAALERGRFDLLVLDVMLPGMSGLALAERVRRSDTTTPMLMISALADVDDRVVGLEHADDYLAKPFEVRELLARCAALVRRRVGPGDAGPEPAGARPPTPQAAHDRRLLGALEAAAVPLLSNSDLTVEDLSRAVGMSRRALHDHLRAMGRESPGEWLRELRLKRAMELIERGEMQTVGEVAAAVGMSRAWFSRVYKARTGRAPGAQLKERFGR